MSSELIKKKVNININITLNSSLMFSILFEIVYIVFWINHTVYPILYYSYNYNATLVTASKMKSPMHISENAID